MSRSSKQYLFLLLVECWKYHANERGGRERKEIYTRKSHASHSKHHKTFYALQSSLRFVVVVVFCCCCSWLLVFYFFCCLLCCMYVIFPSVFIVRFIQWILWYFIWFFFRNCYCCCCCFIWVRIMKLYWQGSWTQSSRKCFSTRDQLLHRQYKWEKIAAWHQEKKNKMKKNEREREKRRRQDCEKRRSKRWVQSHLAHRADTSSIHQ